MAIARICALLLFCSCAFAGEPFLINSFVFVPSPSPTPSDSTPPEVTSAVFTDASTLVITFSENVNGCGLLGSDACGFFIDNEGHNSISTCSTPVDNTITCVGGFSGGETLDYTAANAVLPVTDFAAGNPLADFAGFATSGPP